MSVDRPLACMLAVAMALASAWQPAEAKGRKDKEATQPFIVETRISAPKRVGEFVLEQSGYDPAAKYAGASFRYLLPQYPEIRFDLFVYPAGEMPADAALKAGMKNFVESFDAGVKMKYYNDLEIVDTVAFEILPKHFEPAAQDKKNATSTDDSSEADARSDAAFLAALAPKPLAGKRIDLRYKFNMEDTGDMVPMRSRGYLFYKQLYFFKGRISVAESRMDQATYETLSDRAMRELVPALRATNIGGCARKPVALSLDELHRNKDDLMMQVLGALTSKTDLNCYVSIEDAQRIQTDLDEKNAEVVTIEYDAKDWGDP